MDLLERQLGHDRWTTSRLLTTSRVLTDAQVDQEFDIGRRTIRKTFDHMVFAVDLWTGLMTGTPVDYYEVRDHLNLDTIVARHERGYDAFVAIAKQIVSDGRLDETFVDHYDYPQSYGGTISQVMLHNHGHRTEILHMFARLDLHNLPDGDVQEWEHTTGLVPTP